jgi:hypothetical protein
MRKTCFSVNNSRLDAVEIVCACEVVPDRLLEHHARVLCEVPFADPADVERRQQFAAARCQTCRKRPVSEAAARQAPWRSPKGANEVVGRADQGSVREWLGEIAELLARRPVSSRVAPT